MPDSRIDWPGIAEAAVTALLGEPNRKLSRGRRWRYGTKGSLSVYLDKAAGFDFEGETGAGLSKLIERGIGGDWKAAWRWLEASARAGVAAGWRPLHGVPWSLPIRCPGASRRCARYAARGGYARCAGCGRREPVRCGVLDAGAAGWCGLGDVVGVRASNGASGLPVEEAAREEAGAPTGNGGPGRPCGACKRRSRPGEGNVRHDGANRTTGALCGDMAGRCGRARQRARGAG